uniref:Uncharacterized protein n=1 Tax=Cacopsylla melanoneura TaxID=428564 RepID=A0A8D8M4P0_9HEMI
MQFVCQARGQPGYGRQEVVVDERLALGPRLPSNGWRGGRGDQELLGGCGGLQVLIGGVEGGHGLDEVDVDFGAFPNCDNSVSICSLSSSSPKMSEFMFVMIRDFGSCSSFIKSSRESPRSPVSFRLSMALMIILVSSSSSSIVFEGLSGLMVTELRKTGRGVK